MEITKKLYDADSHIRSFDAKVTGCSEEKNRFGIELDQTAFFAEGGGQQADRGVLDGQTVLDVQEKGGHVYHYVHKAIPVGKPVHGEIDWPFRFTNMQQHSGEHILSGLAYAWKGYHNVGFHMNASLTTIDFDGAFTAEELMQLELQANRVIYENQPVTICYPSAEELERMDYRSKKKLTGAIRIVRVGESDCCACCAPHVRRTGEIGQIKIIDAENYKGGVRLTIVCGERALLDYDQKNQLLKKLGNRLSAKPEQVEEAFHKQEEQMRDLKERLSALSAELIRCRLQQLPDRPSECLTETAMDAVAARSLVNGMAEKLTGHGAVLLPKGTGEYLYIIGSRQEDVRLLARQLAERFGGRGGGSCRMVQGTVRGNAEEIAAFLRQSCADIG